MNTVKVEITLPLLERLPADEFIQSLAIENASVAIIAEGGKEPTRLQSKEAQSRLISVLQRQNSDLQQENIKLKQQIKQLTCTESCEA